MLYFFDKIGQEVTLLLVIGLSYLCLLIIDFAFHYKLTEKKRKVYYYVGYIVVVIKLFVVGTWFGILQVIV